VTRRTLALALVAPAVVAAVGFAAGQKVPHFERSEGVSAVAATSTAPTSPVRPGDTSDGAAAAPPQVSMGPPEAPADTGGITRSDPSGDAPTDTASGASGGAMRSPGTTDDATGPVIISAEGFHVAPGGTAGGTGPRWRYTVEVEPATGLDLAEVARQVTRSLHDPRSWTRNRTLEQVDDPTAARIRLVVATPDTVDRLCAQVGLRTVGIFSCWNGQFAALNAWRWEEGAAGFSDLDAYRTYLVNHEFGHGLGYGHVGCPSRGAPAPVMMQQSKGLAGCQPNGWPYP